MTGKTIGKYRVLDRLGRGGMGTVYRAVDEMLHRDVAIKVLNAELNDPEIAKRFRSEAITIARLSHPGIATIYELFEHDGEWLMVMEFVRGETLEGMVARMGPLSPQRAAELCMQALGALAHAHSMGVVHRDLKPANLMITETGAIKVMDFGIARVSGSEHLTNAGFMMGTPSYMAPEQVKGGEVDARADLYAMGVVFYRLTTAALPFKGETPFAMVQSQVNDPPTPVGLLRADLPGWVEEIVTRALAKEPDQRFQSAAEFHEAFARCLAGLPLSSMYVSSPGDPTMTPSRAMPSGAFQFRPMHTPTGPLPIPTMPTPTPIALTSSQPTMAAPGTNPGSIAGSADPTIAAGSTGSLGSNRPAEPSEPAKRVEPVKAVKPSAKSSLVLWLGVAGAAVLVAVVAMFMFRGGATPGPAASPTPLPVQGAPGESPLPQAGDQSVVAVSPVPATPGAAPAPSPATPAAAKTGGGITLASPSRSPSPPSPPTPAMTSPAPAATSPARGAGTPVPGAAVAAAASGGRPAGAADTGAAPPAGKPAADALVTFPDVKLYQVVGKRTTDTDAVLNFSGGQLLVMPSTGGAAMATVPFKRITHATYVHARDPKWDPTLATPPDAFGIGGLIRTARHWLVLQGPDHIEILRLDDSNFGRILEAFESRTGIKIDRPK